MLPELRTEIPGPESRRLAAELARYESRNVTFLAPDFPIFWERASGMNVWDVDGNRFLDLTSAFAVAGLGHGATPIAEAMRDQSTRLIHAMGDVHPTREKVELCRALSAVTFERWAHGEARTILTNSGSEAVEAALKTALLHTGKAGILSFEGGYHGLGHGALAAGGISWFREPFAAQLASFGIRLPYPASRAEVESALLRWDIGAILVEPVQGRGGEIVPPPDFLPMLREVCSARGTLLILDEIYTGFHRTGRLFACEHVGVVPDVICLGKALTSGFPLSACVGRADVMDSWPLSRGEALHTSTFLGNPVGCAMALASIREHLKPETEVLVAGAATKLDRALESLRSPAIRELRGIGLMRGIELVDRDGSPATALAGKIVTQSLEDGLLLLAGSPTGNVVSLTPPFAISPEETSFAVERIQEYLTSLAGSIS